MGVNCCVEKDPYANVGNKMVPYQDNPRGNYQLAPDPVDVGPRGTHNFFNLSEFYFKWQ